MAHSYVKEYLEKVTEQSQETAEQYRRMHLARIDSVEKIFRKTAKKRGRAPPIA